MKINATPPYNPTMGLNRIPTKRTYYLADCYWEKDIINLKDYTVSITRNYLENELVSKLIYVKDKAGKWVKSKLRYFENGKWKVTRSENKCLEK
jgi:hypothetical protein